MTLDVLLDCRTCMLGRLTVKTTEPLQHRTNIENK